jgi:hypothetical protein
MDTKRTDSTKASVEETLRLVKKIQADLGIADDAAPVKARYTALDNYPAWTKHHHSLTSKYCTPEIYQKYAGVKTPGGFTFDQVRVRHPTNPTPSLSALSACLPALLGIYALIFMFIWFCVAGYRCCD